MEKMMIFEPAMCCSTGVCGPSVDNEGMEILPVIMVDGIVVKTKGYPSNEELYTLLDLPEDYLKAANKNVSK